MDRRRIATVVLCVFSIAVAYADTPPVIEVAEPADIAPLAHAAVQRAPADVVTFTLQIDDRAEEITAGEPSEAPKSRLDSLLKPIVAVEFPDAPPSDSTPPNRAADAMELDAPYLITATPVSLRGPNRYPIPFLHRPLYYEERALERCGDGYGLLQPAVSMTGFLSNTMLMPYRMTLRSPHHVVVSPGDCTTCETMHELEPIWFDTKALALEAAVAAGFAILLL